MSSELLSSGRTYSRKIVAQWRQYLFCYLMVLPAFTLVSLLVLYPALHGIKLSFYDVHLLRRTPAHFVWFDTYRNLFNDSEMILSVWRALLIAVSIMSFTIFLGMGLALLLRRPFRGKNIIQALLFLPWILPETVVAATWKWLFGAELGMLNALFMRLGLLAEPQPWLAYPGTAITAVIVACTWRSFPFATILISAALTSIPEDYYEAARIDGAGSWQLFRFITLPGIRYILGICILTNVIWAINNFGMIYIMTGGGPGFSTTTTPIYIYRLANQFYRMSDSAAISTLLFIIIFILSLVYIRNLRIMEEE